MISIIVCSADAARLDALKENIANTIGLPHEVIAIDNRQNRYGICEAYNLGGHQAAFPVLCFTHEDVSFDTMDWGKIVCHHLSDASVGLVGIAGGDAKSLVPSSWSIPIHSREINVLQHYRRTQGKVERLLESRHNPLQNASEVACLDGVWLCTRKSVFQTYQFDAERFVGFHGYDIDYSLQVATHYKLHVIFDIQIHHYSEGSPGSDWFRSAISVSHKWRNRLPASVYPTSNKVLSRHHWQSMQVFLQHASRLGIARKKRFMLLCRFACNKYFAWRPFLSMCRYILQS